MCERNDGIDGAFIRRKAKNALLDLPLEFFEGQSKDAPGRRFRVIRNIGKSLSEGGRACLP